MPRTNKNTNPTTRVTRQTTNSKPAAKSAAKPAATKPVAKPAATKPVAKPIAKPAVAKPIAKPAVAKPIAKPAVAKPVTKPTVAKPVAKPAAAKPVAKPNTAKPAANKPITKKPAAVYGTKKHPLKEIDANREANGASSDSESDLDSDSDSESMSESTEPAKNESHSSRMAERLAAMDHKMAAKDAQLVRLRKKMGIIKAAKKRQQSLIPRPKPLGNLQCAMRLAGGSSEHRDYLNTRIVLTTLIGLGVNVETDTFRSFTHFQLARFISVLKDEMPIFSRYEDVWPIPDLIQSVLKNKRHHKSRVRRAEQAANPSADNSTANQSHEDSTTPLPNAPATPGNNAQDDDLTLPARAYFSPLSPFSATTNFQWHELENYADKFERDAQADSDDDADDNGDRVFGGRNTSSYIRRSRFNHENEDGDSEDGDDTMGNWGGFEDEDAEMGGDLDVEHEDDEDMENREDEGGEDEDGEQGEEDEDGEQGEEEDDEENEEVTVGMKRKAHSAIMDARNKKVKV